jgi:hypothetical protein
MEVENEDQGTEGKLTVRVSELNSIPERTLYAARAR